MNTPPLAHLLGLRYRLLWAQVRLRNGKIALFFVGYLFAMLIIAFLALGGYRAAMASIRLGKAELVASVVLAGFYLMATLASIILGIGINPAFSDAALRRYSLTPVERLVARQLTAFLDPMWMFILAFDLGVVAGLYTFGVGSLWLAVPAAVLLVLTNYLSARVLSGLLAWVLSTRSGMLIVALAIILLIMLVSAGPALFAAGLSSRSQDLLAAILTILKLTPPFIAAKVMTGAPALSFFFRLVFLLGWCLGLLALLVAIERLPVPSRTVAAAEAEWDGPCDRFAALFGSSAPLVAKILRYYFRTNRSRIMYLMNVPALLLVIATFPASHREPLGHFFMALGVITTAGFTATSTVAINAFGHDGCGFRRYFLLPVAPEAVLRTTSAVALLLGAPVIPIILFACFFFSRVQVDARMAAMLVANAVGGLFFFQALAVWTSLLAPSQSDGTAVFKNDYSFAANVVGQGGLLGTLFGTIILGHYLGAGVLRYWWVAPVFMIGAVAFYLFTLRTGAAVFVAHRERLLLALEQQSGRFL